MLFPCWPFARCIDILSSDCGATGKCSGSETARDPSGMIMDLLPENVTSCNVSSWISDEPAEEAFGAGSAMVMLVMGSSVAPKAFEILIRIHSEEPIDVWMVWRMVELLNTSPV